MAKNWYDGPVPTADLGILGGLPSLALTEEDKKRAFWQAMMQGGMGMAAASLGGANTSQALGKGLLGGADAYGQGLMAPQSRFDAYAKQLKVQGDQIGNAKGLEELGKLKREASDYGKQNDFFSMLNDPGQAAMLYGGGPTLQNEQRATQFGANPAAMLSDPRINLKALQARVDPKQLGAALENTRPYEQKPGMFYNGQYMPDPTKGIAFNNGVVAPLKGAQETQNALAYGTKAGELAAQLAYEQAKLPNDVRRAGQVADAEAGARDKYGFFQTADDRGRPVWQTNPQARSTMDGRAANQFPGARIDPQAQAQRDAVAQNIYNAEGAGKYSPRLNDSPGGGVRPQVADLPGIRGQAPADAAEQKGIREVLVNDVYKPAQLASSKSSTLIPLIDRQLSLINQGSLIGNRAQPVMNTIRSWAQASGLSDAETNNILNGATEFRQFANKAVLNGPRMEGPQSDKDRAFYTESNAQITDPTQAIKQSLTYAKAENERNIEYRRFIDSHLQKGGSLQDVRAQWENGPGAKSVWEHPKLKEFLPTVVAQSGPYKGRQMVQLPDGRFTLR